MANSLSILPAEGRVRVFACAACGQTIGLGCDRCRFCSVRIDPVAAAAAADLMDRVTLACNQAEEIRAILWHQNGMFWLFSRQNIWHGLLVPFQIVLWWVRFGSLRVEDDDLIRARDDMTKYAIVGGVVLLLMLAAFLRL